MFWRRRKSTDGAGFSLDEYLGEGENARAASPLELARWQERLSKLTSNPLTPRDLALPAFSLVRGGDLYEPPKSATRTKTSPELVDTYADQRLRLAKTKTSTELSDAALEGILRVVRGNPAICRRMLLAKPISVIVLPKGHDFRQYGFPANANPRAAGLFWNTPSTEQALIGLREELVLEKPYLMIHEMTHAVHLMGMTQAEREDIDRMLVPVYRSRRWVEEVVAIYSECVFSADYSREDLEGRSLYAKTRREFTDRAVFSLFMMELLRP